MKKQIEYRLADKDEIIEAAKESGYLSFDIEWDPELYDNPYTAGFEVDGCSFASITESGELIGNYFTDFEVIQEILDACFFCGKINLIAHYTKSDIVGLSRSGSGFRLPQLGAKYRDTAVSVHLIDEDRLGGYSLKVLVPEYLGYDLEDFDTASSGGLDSPEFKKYACEDSIATLELYLLVLEEIKRQGLEEVHDMVIDDIITFADIEMTGINFDMDSSEDMLIKLSDLRDEVEDQIYASIGKLNLASPKQLNQRLFNEMGMSTKGLQRTDSGKAWKTDDKTIGILAKKYPDMEYLSVFRSCNKMIGTYLRPFSEQTLMNYDGRVRSRYGFTQKTSRTNSIDPNVQNLPAGGLGGSIKFNEKLKAYLQDIKIRSGIVATKGRALIVVDLSSIEYRVSSICAADPLLTAMYKDWECEHCGAKGSSSEIVRNCTECGEPCNQGKDLHQFTADLVTSMGYPISRKQAKSCNFLAIFFGSANRLAEDLGCPKQVAQKILDTILGKLKGLQAWHKSCQSLVRKGGVDRLGRDIEKGTILDLFGRKRRLDLPETLKRVKRKARAEDWDNDTLGWKLRGAEKNIDNMAINYGCQSSAAMIAKLSMSKFRKVMIERGLWDVKLGKGKASIINFVHDQVDVECCETIAFEVYDLLSKCLSETVNIGVPIPCEGSIAFAPGYTGELKNGAVTGNYSDCK